jgi:hypothetical protein
MKKIGIIFLTSFLALVFTGCVYDFVIPEQVYQYNPGGSSGGGSSDISFSKNVETIFNTGNNCTACHKSGGTNPDLTTGKAYASITSLISTSSPETSKIYLYPAPTTSTHSHKKYTAAEATTVLNWIKQGAKNN